MNPGHSPGAGQPESLKLLHAVFISHASDDSSAAESVCVALEAAGIHCWIAPRDVRSLHLRMVRSSVVRTPGPDDNHATTTSVPTSNFLFEIFATLSYKRSVVDDAVRRVH